MTLAAFIAMSPGAALASQTVALTVKFTPYRLGAGTTISYHTHISNTNGTPPSPVTKVNVLLPRGMGLGTTTLGEEICNPTALTERGLSGCSENSVMGHGRVSTELKVGDQLARATATTTILMGPPIEDHTSLLVDAVTSDPVSSQIILHTRVLAAPNERHRADLATEIPLTPSWPEASPTSTIDSWTSIGPAGLTYHKTVHGKEVAYHPTGMAIPNYCPAGGFVFVATYNFADGTTTSARGVVPCPTAPAPAHHKRQRHAA